MRERVGLFDVSHMGEFDVTGRDALAYLQWMTPNDVGKLADGRIHYSAFLTRAGDLRRRPARLPQVAGRLPARRQRRQHAQGLRLGDRARAGRRAVDRPQRRLRADRGPGPEGGGAARARLLRPIRPTCRTTASATRRSAARRRSSRAPATRARTASRSTAGPRTPSALFRALLDEGKAEGAAPVRPRRARHAAARGEDGALRQRHRRHGHAAGGGPRLDREDGQGRLPRARRARRAEAGGRAAQARRVRDGRPRHRAPRLPGEDRGRARAS